MANDGAKTVLCQSSAKVSSQHPTDSNNTNPTSTGAPQPTAKSGGVTPSSGLQQRTKNSSHRSNSSGSPSSENARTAANTYGQSQTWNQYQQRQWQHADQEPRQHEQKKESLSKLIQERKVPFFGLALVALGMSFYIGKLGVALYNSSDVDVQRMTAREFDKSLDFPEWFMGITTLRSKLARRARGQVLEVAVGTGRNMVYFNWHDPETDPGPAPGGGENAGGDASSPAPIIAPDVVHYTGMDINDDMLALAIKRARGIVGNLIADESSFRLIHGDVLKDPLPRPPDGKSAKYDTVIQSFGLCSVEDPVELVKNLATMVKPNFGRILLLEHGRGSIGFVNRVLDNSAEKHFEKHACWWNRDIEQIVRTAAEQVPGLEIRRLERPKWLLQAGTVLLIELRVKQVIQPDGTGTHQDAQKPRSTGWFGLRTGDDD
ncbi:hypothetical protein MKZ38_004304 [Zalerion maritima]|uniref:Methyltransferase OMS1 n=1 Tax=Zalerion maritima TaxID=339359 RepID=A0AAD5RSU8_9PEZI|nr:hypothetical protein MKZ38_004304 [Zalerion maritima]